jgi:hypothetical protein
MRPLDRLSQPSLYREQMDRLEVRLAGTGRLDGLTRDKVSLRSLIFDRGATARRLAAAVAAGGYELRPGTISVLGDARRRRIFCFDATDWLVHSAAGAVLTEAFEPRLSSAVYSYRPGRSSWEAALALGEVVREHRRAAATPERRGLYALRADVSSYGDSIPIAASSPLWPALLDWLDAAADDPLFRLVAGCVRPSFATGDGALACRARGIPVGSPIANPLTNLYLDPVDRALSARGGFYARFGDDLVFAHADPKIVAAAAGDLDRLLGELGLEINREKRAAIHLNAAGRPGPDGFRGTSMIEYVGCRIGADGAVGLPAPKVREVVSDLRARLRRQARLWRDEPIDDRAAAACELVGRALDPANALAVRHAALLRAAVNDRSLLEQLDYAVAREVVGAVTGDRSPRGFRRLPYRRLRELGLASLVVARNRKGRKRS